MPNTLITPSIIAKEALFQLENNLILGNLVHRDYKEEFVKIGDTVSVRRPVKFVASSGATRVNQDVIESTTPITIDQRRHVSWSFPTQDMTLTIEDFSERYIKPAAIVLANEVDVSLANQGAQSFYNLVGTPGTAPANYDPLADAAQRMDEMAVPDKGDRCMVVNPRARWALARGLGGRSTDGVDNPKIVDGMIRHGYLGPLANFHIYGDQNVAVHTCGTQGGTPLTNGVPAVGATTLVLDGATASVANWARVGDVFTIAGVNAVNPVSKADQGRLAEFVVTANATVDGSGNVTLSISPEINDGSTQAGQQNVSALPADNAAITFLTGASAAQHPQNLAFHKNALALVTCPLEVPESAGFKARMDWRGLSIRVVRDYNIDSDVEAIRLDILYGTTAIYPDLGVRVSG